jgi:hypothetical protein
MTGFAWGVQVDMQHRTHGAHAALPATSCPLRDLEEVLKDAMPGSYEIKQYARSVWITCLRSQSSMPLNQLNMVLLRGKRACGTSRRLQCACLDQDAPLPVSVLHTPGTSAMQVLQMLVVMVR